MKRYFLAAVLLLCASIVASSQQLQNLPNDPEVKVGKLDNGLTYYVRHNDKPANRCEFYLATNVGAIQETPDQDGLAHFLEHMCFNGTKNFPGKGIIDWVTSIGASFGSNINAATGVEQTTYMLTNMPLVRPTVVDTCLLILHDYSHFVSCDPEEIDKERGVIIEEKRSRNTASWRIREKAFKYYYGDSKYANCTIIGSQENLETFQPSSLTDFYHTWYRPDMQAVVVVGDIDVDEVEAKIASTFADIPAQENPKAKDVIKIPDNAEPLVGVVTDPELTSSGISMLWKSEAMDEAMNSTVIGVMTNLVQSIISMAMRERFNDIAARPDAPFLSAGLSIGNLCETSDAVMGNVAFKEGEALPAFGAFLTEVEKMRRFGFSDSEVERAKANILSGFESRANKADTRKNSEFVQPLINHFFDNYEFMTPAAKLELVKGLLPNLQTPMLNQAAAAVITEDNVVVVYTAPEKEGLVHPTAEQLLAQVKAVRNAEIENAGAEEIPTEFLDPAALKGSIVKKSGDYSFGARQYILGNGLKVILLPTDYEKDRISISLYKKGGMSLISTEDLPSFDGNIWGLWQDNTGIGQFPGTVVPKMLSGKNLGVQPYIDRYTHGVSATSSVKDIETALQLVYMQFAQPRFDIDEYQQGIKMLESIIPNYVQQPNYKLNQAVYATAYDSPRKVLISQETLEKASLKTIEKNYRKLFKGVNGATMIVVGDFDTETILPLICKYAGSISKGGKATGWKYMNDGILPGERVCDFQAAMQAPKVTVFQCWSMPKAYSVQDEVTMETLRGILYMLYVDTLREDEGGTYGASVNEAVGNKPDETVALEVVFETNPEQADRLRALCREGLEGIAKDGPDAVRFDNTVKNIQKKISENKIRNGYWMNAIGTLDKFGIDRVEEYEKAVNALTPQMVQDAASQLVSSGNFVEVVMRPASEN